MLKGITIENFRSWSERTDFEIKPLTLIFGPNSAGKSSIFHALALFRQTLEHANGTSIPMISVGSYTDLGDFQNLVSNHDMDRFIKIGFSFISDPQHPVLSVLNREWRVLIEIRSSDSAASRGEISRFWIEIGKDALVFESSISGFKLMPQSASFFSKLIVDSLVKSSDKFELDHIIKALRIFEESGCFSFLSGFPSIFRIGSEESDELEEVKGASDLVRNIWALLSGSIREEIFNNLSKLFYLGPLRKAGQRFYLTTKSDQSTNYVGPSGENLIAVMINEKYFSGQLQRNENKLENIMLNKTLEEMGYDYRIEVMEWHDESVGRAFFPLLKQISNGVKVNLCDVGSGISQSLPVIVQLLACENEIVYIEQPEIHLHAKLHIAMAELIIKRLNDMQNLQMICETHSPELCLRILRSVSDNAANNEKISILLVRPPNINENKRASQIQEIEVYESGTFKEWPGGFFKERADEMQRIMGVK